MKTIAQILSIFAFSPLISLAQPSGGDDGLVAEYLFSGNWQDSSTNANNLVPRGAEFGPDRFGNPNGADIDDDSWCLTSTVSISASGMS